MAVAFILPPTEWGQPFIERCCRHVVQHFGKEGPVRFFSDTATAYPGLPAEEIRRLSTLAVHDYAAVVIPAGHPMEQRHRDIPRLYRVDRFARLTRPDGMAPQADYPAADAHTFNRLGPGTDYSFYYFPYGYLFRYTGMGPINAFGHRIDVDLQELADRGPTHKVIANFGGSSGFSMYCMHDEMYTSIIENMLNSYCRENYINLTFTVLNFGQHGNVVLNEMTTFMLFCHNIRPDIVIGHDGWNDFNYGAACDPFLLNEYQICYQHNLENWSQILHNTHDVSVVNPHLPLKLLNYPAGIIDAYLLRKRQFRTIVQAQGGVFVWGLQPAWFSKSALSSQESQWIGGLEDPHFQDIAPRLLFLFNEALATMKAAGDIDVDLHTGFSRYGAGETLFFDHIHATADGDRRIAEAYFEYIRDTLLPSFTGAA